MNALSLWQPWASLIVSGAKTIETRGWPAPNALIGQRLAIHAASKSVRAATRDSTITFLYAAMCGLQEGSDWRDRFNEPMCAGIDTCDAAMEHLPTGAVVCIATLEWCDRVACLGPGPDAEVLTRNGRVVKPDPFGDFSVGRWLWGLGSIQVLETPIPARGRQRVFSLEIAEEPSK